MVPVCLELSALKQAARTDDCALLEFVVVDRTNAASIGLMNDTFSRRLKGIYNTGNGYYAYAVLSGGKLIGDIWCASARHITRDPVHPDLVWLGITCKDNEAYMFDMYVAPGSRGKVATSFLLAGALAHLREQGYARVYGFYEKANLPALWTHRLFGYQELPNRKITRVLLYEHSEALP